MEKVAATASVDYSGAERPRMTAGIVQGRVVPVVWMEVAGGSPDSPWLCVERCFAKLVLGGRGLS